MKPKIIAMYLPQFHQIPENDEFWGEGFTDWVTVKNARSLFEGHHQPRIPLNYNYYDLSQKENIVWQAKLAKDYGIDGFGIYHYWFNNEKNLLTKPIEIIRDNSDIDINYFLAWDNNNWKRSWSNVKGNDWAPSYDQDRNGPTVLIPYILGDQNDWANHYKAIRTYLLDCRYIKVENKPVFIIFNYDEKIKKMCDYWDMLAKKDGFDGMFYIFRYNKNFRMPDNIYKFKYEPLFSGLAKAPIIYVIRKIKGMVQKMCGIESGPIRLSYDKIWKSIIKNANNMPQKEMYHGAFVAYDDTPRRGRKGTVVEGVSDLKFMNYLSELSIISELQGKEFIFLTAWNEWGESACLEPDELEKYSYLEAFRQMKSNL